MLLSELPMPFALTYEEARDRFRTAAGRLGWELQSFPVVDHRTIDVALSPGSPNDPLLMVSSGVHGVEGIFGSAVQLAALHNWEKVGSPSGVRCVFVHAICPSGFAHIRRFNEENIDLNRNFLPPGEAYAGSPPRYAGLDAALNPKRPPGRSEFFTLRAMLGIARFGLTGLKQAIAGGQYDFPKGMFFGGFGPSRSKVILAEQFPDWLADAPRGVLLDLHSGLGKSAELKLLVDVPPHTKEQLERAARWFDPDFAGKARRTSRAAASIAGVRAWPRAATSSRSVPKSEPIRCSAFSPLYGLRTWPTTGVRPTIRERSGRKMSYWKCSAPRRRTGEGSWSNAARA